ncbi:MAG: type II toxin-antitoxin system PemK/MazF family toxin [Solirubrobacteraceae bacterium]
MNRGEVWWYELPDAGRRPGLILTRQAAIPVLNALLVAPATRTIRGIPTQVRLGPADGMPTECALSLDNLLSVPKVLLTERITRLPPARLAELCAALDIAAGCA